MKRTYEAPELEIVVFNGGKDIITASGCCSGDVYYDIVIPINNENP